MQKHIIKRQILDLQLSSKEHAFEAQTAFRELFMQKLLPILSDYFDSVIPGNVTWTADRLEVDLGVVDFSKMDDYALNVVADKLKKSLSQQLLIRRQTEHQTVASTHWRSIRLLLFFLQNGYLPWWQKNLDFNAFEAQLLTDFRTIPDLVRNQLKAFLERILATENKEEDVFKRLVFQFSDHFISSFLKAVFTSEYKEEFPSGKTNDRKEYWQARIVNLLSLSEGKRIAQLDLDLMGKSTRIKEMTSDNPLFGADKRKEAIKNGPSNQSKEKRAAAQLSEEQHTPGSDKERVLLTDSAVSRAIEDNSIIMPTPSGKIINDEGVIFDNQKVQEADGYYIHNSGLVLIAPYLGHFFTTIGLIRNQAFIDEEAKIRAIHLLQYIATSEEQAPEYDLVLNKILCGISLEKPVLKSVKLIEYEKQEAQQLLEAVIRNWSALKSTSPAGLQEGFLRREGKLMQKKVNGNWLLQVEGKAHDILLGKLPWTYSMIKQSWMPTMLTVEWL